MYLPYMNGSSLNMTILEGVAFRESNHPIVDELAEVSRPQLV